MENESAAKPLAESQNENLWQEHELAKPETGIAQEEPLLATQKVTVGLEIRTTLEGQEIEDLRRLQELMPGVSLKQIIGGALSIYRSKKDPNVKAEKAAKKKPAADDTCTKNQPITAAPAVAGVESHGHQGCVDKAKRPYISVRLKREVYHRDQGRCTYESESGERCNAKGNLEIDHRRPIAKNVETNLENCRLLCRSHNQLLAELHFGREFIQAKRRANSEAAA